MHKLKRNETKTKDENLFIINVTKFANFVFLRWAYCFFFWYAYKVFERGLAFPSRYGETFPGAQSVRIDLHNVQSSM